MTAGALVTKGDDAIALDPDLFWCDAVAFELLLDGGKEEEAMALYRGALLEGFHLPGCLEFERWLEDERRRLEPRAAAATWSLAQQALAEGRTAQAMQWGRRALAFSPDDEGVLRRVIDLLDRLGDRAGAVREYEAFAKRLQEDYDADPAPETTELIAAVRAREQANDSVLPSTPLTKPPVDAALASVTTQPRASLRTRGRAAPAIVVLGAIAAFGAAIIRNRRGEAPDLDPRLVLVRPFSNETGRPELERLGNMPPTGFPRDWPKRKWRGSYLPCRSAPMTRSTQRSRRPERVRYAGLAPRFRGPSTPRGTRFRFQVQVLESRSGEILASVGPVLASVQDPRADVDELRQRTTGALASAVDPLLASWVAATRPPPSYEAYQLFAQGFDVFFGAQITRGSTDRAGFLTAADYFRQAADLDSTYALPLLWEVYARRNGADREGRDSTLDDLTRRRDTLTRWEQNLLDALLAREDGDWLRQYAVLSRLVAMRPGSEWNYRLAAVAADLGRFEEAATLLEEVTDQGWLAAWEWYWWILTQARHFAGQYERELRDARAFRVRYPDVRGVVEIFPLAALGRVEEALGLARTPGELAILVSELFNHGHPEAAQSVIRNHLPRGDLNPIPNTNPTHIARVLFWTGRLTEAEDLLRHNLEERPTRFTSWPLLVEVVLAKGDREEAVRISNHVAELDGYPVFKAMARAKILMHLGDRAGAVELMRPIFRPQRNAVQLHLRPHRMGPLPQSMADYAPFQELVGWPPPLPN